MPEKVKMTLIGVNGNAYSIMGEFSNYARKQGWTEEEIRNVLDEAMRDDYGHLLRIILKNIEDE